MFFVFGKRKIVKKSDFPKNFPKKFQKMLANVPKI